MRDSMVETIYQPLMKSPSRFVETTEQEATLQNNLKSLHEKTSYPRSSQISDNEQLAAICTNTVKQGNNSMRAADPSFKHSNGRDQVQPSERQPVDTELFGEENNTLIDLDGDNQQAELQRGHERKFEPNNSLPILTNKPSPVQASSNTGLDSGIPIPGSKTKRYWPFEGLRHPLLSVIELNSRKEGVIGRLKNAVDDHEILQHRASFINYKAGMVGRISSESWPSILLFCQEKDQRYLKKLLDPGFLTRINCCSPYRPYGSKLLSWASVPNNPSFWIYIFPSATNPTNQFAGSLPVAISFNTKLTPDFCGALVEHQGRVATIGLTVEVDGIVRLLTVDHIFNVNRSEDQFTYEEDDDETSWYYESGDEIDGIFSAAHSKVIPSDAHLVPMSGYHDEEAEVSSKSLTYSKNHMSHDTRTCQSEATHQNVGQDHDEAATPKEAPIRPHISAHRVQWPNDLPREHSFLDWVCLEIDGGTMEEWLQGYISEGLNESLVQLKEIEDVPSSYITSVLMISGTNGVRPGRLLPESGYLGSVPGRKMTKMWTLILDSPPGLLPGECGAVVIDKNTHNVYGHVTGSNMLGHAHVVSMREVLDQMKIAFGTNHVHFPCRSSPLVSAKSLNSHESLDTSVLVLGNEISNVNEDHKDGLIQASLSHSKPGHKPSLENPKTQTERISSKFALKEKKTKDSHSKALRSKPTAAPPTSYAAGGPAWSTQSIAGSFPDNGTDDFNPRYASESRKRRDYAIGHTGVAPPDSRRPSHDQVIQAASNLPGHTARTISQPVAYAMQLDIDGFDNEIYGGGSNHDLNGPASGGQASSLDHGSSSSANHPYSSGAQEPSSYYTSTSGGQESSLYYSHMRGGQGDS